MVATLSARKIARFMHGLGQVPEVVEVILWHLSISQRKTRVAKHDRWEDPDDVASVIYEEAKSTAAAFPGPQSFLLTAHDKDDRDGISPLATTGFRVDPSEGGLGGDAMGSEPPTSEGLHAQLMRHVESKEKTIGAMFGTVLSHLLRQNEKQSEQIEHLLAARLQNVTIMEELHSQKHVRDMEAKEVEEANERKKAMMGKIMTYLPVAINHLAGKELVRQKDSELELVSKEFVASLTLPQLDALRDANLLKPEQMVLMGTMLEKVAGSMITAEEKAAQSKEAQAIANQLPSEREKKDESP